MNRLGFRYDNLQAIDTELLASPESRARRRVHATRDGGCARLPGVRPNSACVSEKGL